MRVSCPYCGERDAEEFTIKGEMVEPRPTPSAFDRADIEAFHHYLHLRNNDFGLTKEYWYHAHGCRRWLIVTRNTRNHEILDVVFASLGQTG